MDYAHARYYSNPQGRFTSPDPFSGSMTLANPQSLNRYSYVTNNPVNGVDPSGMSSHAPMMSAPTSRYGMNVTGSSFTEIAEAEAEYEQRVADTFAAIENNQALDQQQETKPPDVDKQVDPGPESQPESAYAEAVEVLTVDLDNGKVPLGKDGKPITLKGKDGTVFTNGFGVIIHYQVRTGTGSADTGIGDNPVVSEELSNPSSELPKNVALTATQSGQSQKLDENKTFTDVVGIFSNKPIPSGVTATSTQTLNITATFEGREATFPVRTNQLTVDTTKRSVVVKDKTDYGH